MQRVLVLDNEKQPLMPCHPARARILLSQGKAAVYKHHPFTIILKERTGGDCQPVQIKIDQGSKTTGMALLAQFNRGKTVIFGAELAHRGDVVTRNLQSRAAVRRSRRSRKTRYRKPKWTTTM